MAPTDTKIGLRFRAVLNRWLTRPLALMDDRSGRGPQMVLPLGEKTSIWGALLHAKSDETQGRRGGKLPVLRLLRNAAR